MAKDSPFTGAIESGPVRNRGYEPTGSVKGAKGRKGGDCVETVIDNNNRGTVPSNNDSFVNSVPSAKVRNGKD